jgi:hypothetical protein
MFPVRYELSSYIPEDDILHSHRRESLKSYGRGNVHKSRNVMATLIPAEEDEWCSLDCDPGSEQCQEFVQLFAKYKGVRGLP